MILEWSRRRGSWSNLLIESLCVAQCNHVLLKLGLNLDKLALFHFPTRPEITTHLHPVMKLLYLMCEKLDTASSTELADRIKSLPELSSLDFRAPRMLEIHLLHCISQKILRIFDTKPQIEMLISRFKETDNLDMYDFLRSNVDRIVSSGLQPQSSSSSSMVVRDKDSASITSPMNSLAISNVTDDDTYQVNKNSPGLLLIINQFKFHTEQDPSLAYLLPSKPLDERRGTEKDVEALQKTFQQFKFDIVTKNDLAHDQILIEITRTIEAMSRASSCLFVAILSHGIEGCVYGSNSIPLEVRDIKNHIYRCGDHLLLGRPKCLIVQACQGQNLQISKPLANNDLQTDSPNPCSYSVAIPPCSDILIAWSTVEGFASLRHVLTGTWFVQTLCQTIGEQFERYVARLWV